jgi:hypothetical protein
MARRTSYLSCDIFVLQSLGDQRDYEPLVRRQGTSSIEVGHAVGLSTPNLGFISSAEVLSVMQITRFRERTVAF